MNPVIFILNTRLIPLSRDCFKSLQYPKLWISFYNELEIADMFPELVKDAKRKGFTHISMVSDNFIVLDMAVKVIYNHISEVPNRVVCSWSHIDVSNHFSEYTNIRKNLLPAPIPDVNKMNKDDFYTVSEMLELASKKENPQTWMNDFCFHTMTVGMWEAFPYHCYYADMHDGEKVGIYADHHLCSRLQKENIRINCLSNSHLYYCHSINVHPHWREWMWGQKSNPKSIYWEI